MTACVSKSFVYAFAVCDTVMIGNILVVLTLTVTECTTVLGEAFLGGIVSSTGPGVGSAHVV